MADRDPFRVDIKDSAYEDNTGVRRLLERPDGEITTGRDYQSEEAAELDAIRLSELGRKEFRLQPAEHDPTEYHAYIVSTGRSTRGYGKTTRNASSDWEYSRKVTIERDEFTCQMCGAVGGPDGDVQLHVDHETAQSAGGSDDPENLQTLCRECHMSKHGSTQKGMKATSGEIAEAVIQRVEKAEVPAFKLGDIYRHLNNFLTSDVDFDRMTGVLDTLIRYDGLEQMEINNSFENDFTGETIEREYGIYYLVTERLDPSLLSYNGGIRYDGEFLKSNSLQDPKIRQADFDDFG